MRSRAEQVAGVFERLVQNGGAKVSISVEPVEVAERQRRSEAGWRLRRHRARFAPAQATLAERGSLL